MENVGLVLKIYLGHQRWQKILRAMKIKALMRSKC